MDVSHRTEVICESSPCLGESPDRDYIARPSTPSTSEKDFVPLPQWLNIWVLTVEFRHLICIFLFDELSLLDKLEHLP